MVRWRRGETIAVTPSKSREDVKNNNSKGSVYARCGCRRQAALRPERRCARAGKPGHGSWYYALDLPREVEGCRLRIRRGGFRTRSEAKAALNRLRLPDQSGCRVATVGQWLTVWSETRLRLRHSTSRSYRSIIEHYLIPHLGRVPLAELDHKAVAAMFRAIIKSGGVSGRPLTARHCTGSTPLSRRP